MPYAGAGDEPPSRPDGIRCPQTLGIRGDWAPCRLVGASPEGMRRDHASPAQLAATQRNWLSSHGGARKGQPPFVHGLRSLAVTTLASLGLSWQVISMLTGHKNPEMIDHYNRPGKDQFAEGMRKYDNHLRLVL